jgi:hypothetical protein
MKDRQLPVIVLTLLAAGLGAVTMVVGMALTTVGQLGFLLNDGRNSTIASLIGVALLVVGIAGLVLAFGLWLQRPWAWGLGIAVFGLSLVVTVISLAAGVSSIGSSVFLIALGVLVIWYLYQPRVKTLYGR